MADSSGVSLLAIAAGVVGVGGFAVAPLATVPVLLLALGIVFAGARRLALIVIVVATLCGVAGVNVEASRRPTPPSESSPR